MWRLGIRVGIGEGMSSDIIKLVSRIASTRVLCVGDVMLDRFITGEVARISPEAPVPILRIHGEAAMLGGAGNVARNVAALGGTVTLIALTGDDSAADEIDDALAGLETISANLVRHHTRPTTIKTRFIAGTQQILRADSEVSEPLDDTAGDALVARAEAAISDHHVLVLSDYGKGVLGRGRAQHLISAAKTAGIPVIVDPKGTDYGIYANADVITPNRKEIREASGMPAFGIDDVADAAKAISNRHELAAVLVTLSQDGMLLAETGEVHHLPAETREVFDVSGAGDTVVATIAGALAAGASLTDAARLANVCAGIVVAKAGTAAAHLTEVVATVHHQDISRAEAKLLNHDQASNRVKVWRRQKLKVGFTNGCFDLLHPGHVSLLRQARNACDRLVVALNSDASVKRVKGETRPIQNEAARATVLASLAYVDTCVLFDADTPIDLITLLKPEVLIKGADYAVDQVIGAPEVKSWGGRVVLAKLEDGFSTTATIARMTANGNGEAS